MPPSSLLRNIGPLRLLRPRLGLGAHLLFVVLVALVPMIVFSVGVTIALWNYQRSEVNRSLQETARALAIAVDRELASFATTLEALAASREISDGMLHEFYEECQRVLPTQPGWRTILLLRPTGEHVLNLMIPFGDPLPSVGDREHLRRVAQTRQPALSDLFIGNISKLPTIDVAVPVIRDGRIVYILAVGLTPAAFDDILQAQNVRADGIAAIFDAEDRFVARSRESDQYIGQRPIEPLLELMRSAPEGVARLPAYDSPTVYSAWSRLPSSRWTVTVGIPAAPIESALARGLVVLVASGLGLLLLGAALATMLGRRVASSIGEASRAAVELARGRPLPSVSSNVAEVAELTAALEEAAALLRRESAQRHSAEEERARLLASEQVARARAEAANRAKDEFLAMLGHELRNPLAAISNAVQVLDVIGKQEGGSIRARDVIARQTRHLARLMDDLLDVGRGITGKITLERKPMDLAAAATHVVSTLGVAGKTAQHELVLETEPVLIMGDTTRIEQIIGNLITNALKYTPQGGHVRVTVGREQDRAVLRVEDSGIGISAELLPQVFDLFVQGKCSLERAQGGLGIGLTLVRRLVELHGGTVEVASPGPGQGSTFTVQLPVLPAEVGAQVPGSRAAAGPLPCRILLVEDNADARAMLRQRLEVAGHEVHEVADGEAAVAAAVRLRPDLALVDIGLPRLDGYQVARKIRAASDGWAISLVALTGYGLPEDRERALEAGFDEHLVKPVDALALARVLATAVSRREHPPADSNP